MQNIVILIIVAICAVFIGRRFYRNLSNKEGTCECGCSCSQCGPDIKSSCQSNPSELK